MDISLIKGFHHKPRFWLLLAAIAIVIIFLVKCTQDTSKQPVVATQRVMAVTAHLGDVPIYVDGLGTVSPNYSVTIKTQINGQLLQYNVGEGDTVKAGDLIAQIDPRPYEALLLQYQGQLLRDQALLDNANIDLARYQTLWQQDSISEQTLATQIALVKQYEGDIKIDKGLIAAATLNLEYCAIRSPIDGITGIQLIDPGNFVQTTDTTGLVVINTITPTTVMFSLAEDYIPKLLTLQKSEPTPLVLAYDRQQTTLLDKGVLAAIDSQVNVNTGMLNLKANFDNDQQQLFPNQFVNVRLLLETLTNVPIIPTAGVQYNASGAYVYLINDDMTVKSQAVTLGATLGDDIAVLHGVLPGQQVITNGANNITDKTTVHIVNADHAT